MRMPKRGNSFFKGTCTFIMVLFCKLKGELEVAETQSLSLMNSTLLGNYKGRANVSTWGNLEV